MIDIYDRQGNKISLDEYVELLTKDPIYKFIKQTTLEDGTRISTVWSGIDHAYGGNGPIIFETMVFPYDNTLNEECYRYKTEAEARNHHKVLVDAKKKEEQW